MRINVIVRNDDGSVVEWQLIRDCACEEDFKRVLYGRGSGELPAFGLRIAGRGRRIDYTSLKEAEHARRAQALPRGRSADH